MQNSEKESLVEGLSELSVEGAAEVGIKAEFWWPERF